VVQKLTVVVAAVGARAVGTNYGMHSLQHVAGPSYDCDTFLMSGDEDMLVLMLHSGMVFDSKILSVEPQIEFCSKEP
jgi:hypothetical protein